MKKSHSRRKSFDWYGLHQRFSIRKYYFGAASVLLGTALILGGNSSTAQAEEVTATADDAIVADASANSSGADQQSQAVETTATAASEAAQTASVESAAPAASTQGTQSETAQAAPVAATAQVSETAHSQAASTASSQSQAAQVAASETATAQAASQVATASESQAPADFSTTATAAQATADKAASQAQAQATDAKAQTDAAMAAAVVELKKQGIVTDEQGKAILDAYAAGQLSDAEVKQMVDSFAKAGSTVSPFVSFAYTGVNKPQRTYVQNLVKLTDDEIQQIKNAIVAANPTINAADIKVENSHGDNTTGLVYINGMNNGGIIFYPTEILTTKAAEANRTALADSINWFSLSEATRVYPDGTTAYPDGRVVYANGRTGRTSDAYFKNNIAKIVQWSNNKDAVNEYEALQVGMKLIFPSKVDGYQLTAEVTKLAPKDVSKDPVKDKYGQPTNATRIYDPNFKTPGGWWGYAGTDGNYKGGEEAYVIMAPQDGQYSQLAIGGIAPEGTSVDPQHGLITFAPNKNHTNVGVTFKVTATYKGREVAANIIAADAEEATQGELIQFVTDGTPWEEYTKVYSNNVKTDVRPMGASDLENAKNSGFNNPNNFVNAGYDANEWVNTVDGQPVAYGTNTFGPFYDGQGENPVPIGVSRNVKTLSLYINSFGMQQGMIGFVIEDHGDAPSSYGTASHVLGNWSEEIAGGTPVIHSQPYLGSTPADGDFAQKDAQESWTSDDATDDADEGEAQLVGGTYTIRKATEGSYVLENVKANPGQNNAQAYARAFADFNNNGTFDEDEASDVVTVAQDGTYNFTFTNVPQNWEPTQDKMAMRIRIGLVQDEITTPTGAASSGEAEDFQVVVAQPPRGSKEETKAGKGATQTGHIAFSAYGQTESSNYKDANSMDTTKPAKIVLADGSLVDTYTEAGQGTYTVKGWNGSTVDVEFKPVDGFVGTAKGVVVRAWDANNAETGWTISDRTKEEYPDAAYINDGVNGLQSMDAVYVPTVTNDETKSVKRTIKYFYEDKDGNRTPVEEDKVPTVTQSVQFSRPEGSTGDWTVTDGDQNFAEVKTPVLEGYIADRANVEAVTVNAGDQDLTEEVIYKELGSYVPTVPAGQNPIDPIPYPNDPNDPTKPGTPETPIPDVPGYVPNGPDGTPLTPGTNGGYNPPSIPSDPTQDTPITYTPIAVDQNADITFKKDTKDGETLGEVIKETGASNTAIPSTEYTTRLNDYLKQGYKLKEDDFGGNQTFDSDNASDQHFTVVLEDRIEEFDPNNPPTPGQPVNPTDPNSPVWPDSVKDLVGTENVTRTVKYVYADGSKAADDAVQTVTFTRTAKVNLVSGEVTYGDWTSTDTSFDQVDSPVITGYIADKESVAEKAGVQATDADSSEVVTYNKLGSYVPNVPAGENPIDPIPYPNDPTDPTKPGTPETPIPDVPGYVPNGPDGTPLTPDGNGGYNPPSIPSDPTQDTPITYTPVVVDQKADITFKDAANNTLGDVIQKTGKPNEDIPATDYQTRLTDYLKQGYVVKSDDFGGKQTFDNNNDEDQHFTVVLEERVEPVKPGTDKPEPGQPVDPNDPNSPVWPDSVKDLALEEAVTRTVTYSYAENGNQAAEPVAETLTFTREAKVNLKTGEITYGDWTATDTTFDAVNSPVIKGYVADKATVAEQTGVKATDEDATVPVVYTKLGSFVPNVPAGETPINPIPYPNDPTDPTKPQEPGTPGYPVIPAIDGYTPVDPNTKTPLTPVNPEDPSKGYIPPVPTSPTEDTPIEYVQNPTPEADKQKATITFKDTDGKELDKVTEEGDSDSQIPSQNYDDKIKELEKKGYEVVSDDFGGNQTFDKDKDKDQDFTVVVKERVEPVKPGTDKPVPGQPVDPNDPNSPVWPDSVENLTLEEAVTRTVTYSYAENGNQAAEPVTETVTFTRDAEVNLVSGEITYGDWTATDTTFDAVNSPVIKGYVADKATVAEQTGVKATDKDSTEPVVYTKLGSFVPNVPAGETPIDPIPYPNDPTDPTKPQEPGTPNYPVIPAIDGYTPKDPDGNPLEPVDPTDPSKGYVPPVPQDPTKDTPISYDKNPDPQADIQTGIITFEDESGKELGRVTETGESNTPISEDRYQNKLDELHKEGYEVVTDEFKNSDKTFDNDKDKDQTYKVVVKERVEPVKPGTDKPVPGQPVDPTDPNSPVWPDSVNDLVNEEAVTRTVKYVYAKDGSEASSPVAETVTFTRDAQVNLVSGEITYGDWTATDTTFDAVNSPVITGFVADRASVAEKAGVQATDKDFEEKVVYTELGSWIPKIPENQTPDTPASNTPYPNDPNDPTKPGEPINDNPDSGTPVVPHVDGYTPVDPNSGEPLQPVDPNDPSKGYVPPVPQVPTADTEIPYREDNPAVAKGQLIVQYVDKEGTALLPSENAEGEVGQSYTTTAKVVTGYILKETPDNAQGNYTEGTTTVTYVYDKLGSYVPNIPGQDVPEIPYPNDPTDPTNPMDPNDPDYPVIPDVPGYTPVDPNTKTPLTPVDPNDPSKGYIPPVPQDPTKDTPIEYTENPTPDTPTPVADKQKATITFKDTDGKELDKVTEEGDSDSQIPSQNYDDKIKELEKKGYEVVSDDFGGNQTFDKDKDKDQDFTVVVKERVEPVKPGTDKPEPGQPVDPNDPNSPVWPDSVKDLVNEEAVTRTVKYVYAKDGSEASSPVAETVTFTRDAQVNLVTGEVTYGDWTATDTTFDAVKSPVITGYVADKASVAEKAGVQATDKDSDEVVTYTELGSYVPNVPAGETPIDPIQYPNDPTDPTKPQEPGTPDYPVIPGIDGYTPVDPNTNTPLTPVDPNDPSKGYVPPVPGKPTEDTPINYVPNKPVTDATQNADITFKSEDGTTLSTVKESGKSTTPISETQYNDELTKYHKAGYEVVSDNFGGNKVFDNDETVDQHFQVVLKDRVEPVKPGTDKPVPGQPVDPNDPNSPVWPDSVKDLVNEEAVTRTVKYVYAKDNSKASDDVVETVTFTRDAQVDLVTGEITYGDWVATDTTFDAVKSPVITGYVADKASVAEKAGVQATDKDSEEVVTYTELGSYVPNVPAGETPIDPIQYPNDPTDPTKPQEPGTPDYPVIPGIDGYTPVDPNTGNPLDPVDPEDPSKGYVPPVPGKPTEDTPINYVPNKPTPTPTDGTGGGSTTPVADKQKATITFKDTDGNEFDKVTEEGDSDSQIPSQNYDDKIKELEKKGYEVVSDDFGGNQTFDKDKDKDQDFTVVVKERVEPVKPGTDKPVPGQPVDPNDPNSPVWPDSVKDLVNEEAVTRTVKYVYADGSKAAEDVVETVTFTRDAQVNLVTGEITYGDWTATDTTFDAVSSPVIDGYVADKAAVAEKDGVKATDADSEEVVTYTKLGSYVPNIPGKETPEVPYTNDPKDPTKPVDPKDPSQPTIPYEPGFTPVDPNTNTPLTPADPNDPTKGYIPPVPQDPTKDTEINYVANDSKVVVNYVDRDGNSVAASESLTGKVGDDYSTTGKLVPGYILVETPANASGKMVDGGSVVTYVYEKLGSYEIEIPGQGTVKVPYPNDPTDPTKPMDPNDPNYPHVPYIDGYIPVNPVTNEPLKPVDPKDPTKGYIPTVPSDPTKNTPIKYVPANPSDPGQPNNPGTPAKTETKTPGKNNSGTPAKALNNKEDLNKSDKADEKAEQLPETGDQSQGMLLAGLTAMAAGLGLAGFRKKRQDEN